MSKFTKIADFKLPELSYRMVRGDYDFSKQAIIDGNIKMLKSIKNNYGTLIKKWADAFDDETHTPIIRFETDLAISRAGSL